MHAGNDQPPFSCTLCRYLAGALLLVYGFAKLNGSQFTILDSELDKPLGEVSGFWLTWYYFGYSRGYGTILALVQVGGAIALFLPRLALLGASVLFLVVGNIILVDIFYSIDLGALMVALLIEACLAVILFEHRERLRVLLLPAPPPSGRPRAAMAWLLRGTLAMLAFVLTYWTAHYNNRAPTPIDGTWGVMGDARTGELPSHVYFERNRAHMSVFRYGDRASNRHHFEVDRARRSVRIWTYWLSKGPLLYEGTYDPAGKHIVLTGRPSPSSPPVRMQLVKAREPR